MEKITNEIVELSQLDKVLNSIKYNIEHDVIKNVLPEQISYVVYKTDYARNDIKSQLEGRIKSSLDSYNFIKVLLEYKSDNLNRVNPLNGL